MPVHDWTRVPVCIFHAFHGSWIPRIQDALNAGIMPEQYYALAEQSFRETDEDGDDRAFGPDVLTLHADGGGSGGGGDGAAFGPSGGGVAVADAPPRVAQRREVPEDVRWSRMRQNSVAVRHGTGNRLVGLIEIVSHGNKASRAEIDRFADKIVAAVENGVHVLVADLHPPTSRDPQGVHGVLGGRLGDDYTATPGKPLTFASYVADRPPVMYVEPLAVGDAVPDMPLFLDPGHYVNVPLGEAYAETFRPFPSLYREQLEA